MSGVAFTAARAEEASAGDWLALLKPRVIVLVVFTGAVGLLAAPGALHPLLAAVAVLCIAVGAGAAGALNMWWERDIDALMRRTAGRPIPRGRIPAEGALAFGLILSVGSVLLLGLATNWAAGAWLAFSILFYVVVYTMWLKPRTPQNIVIGGAAGAFPPVIGWAAVTGDTALVPWLLFLIVFAWTPPHFWALSLWARADYARAGVPMLPVVAGARHTRHQVWWYTLALLPLSLAPVLVGFSGWAYGTSATVLGVLFIRHAWRVLTDAQDAAGESLTRDAPAKAAFGYSILYLFALFGAFAVDVAITRSLA
jgi:protoheme IX farnesyltransferase